MYIYLLLVSVVLLVPFVCAIIEDREKRNTAILFFSLAFVFLVMALKAPTVGRDIPGYKRIYEIMQLLVHLMVTNYSTALLTLHLSISQQLSL